MIRIKSVKRPTIKDIAKAAGVSPTAVSFTLNDRPGVAEETRDRIRDVATELGWVPNPTARALSGSRTHAVGLVLARPHRALATERFYFRFICGMESLLSQQDYSLVLRIVGSSEEERHVYETWWRQHRVDGVILTDLRSKDPRLELLQNLSIPAVTVGSKTDTFPAIRSNDEDATRAVVKHLVSRKNRDIAYVTGIIGLEHTRERVEAFEASCAESGAVSRCLSTDYTEDAGLAVTRHLISTSPRPSAIVFDNEILALGGITAIIQAGLAIPDDIAVVSFEDSSTCRIANPSITAMQRDPFSLGQQAASLLLEYLSQGSAADQVAAVPELIIRGSS